MKAMLNNYRQSPRKVRIVADLVKGKSVAVALTELSFLPKRAALPIAKLIQSAVANSKSQGVASTDELVVKNLSVTKGPTLKRMRPRARGTANRINKRTSMITLVLGEASKKSGKGKK